jgi:hypothetical protein
MSIKGNNIHDYPPTHTENIFPPNPQVTPTFAPTTDTFQPTDSRNLGNLQATPHFSQTSIQATVPPHDAYDCPTFNRSCRCCPTQFSSDPVDRHTNVVDYESENIESYADDNNQPPASQYPIDESTIPYLICYDECYEQHARFIIRYMGFLSYCSNTYPVDYTSPFSR